jgi:glycosyltransferase involved in cell wall biosynthesis
MAAEPATIVYIVFSAVHAGAEMVLLELVTGLDRTRYRPVVVTLAGPGPLSAKFQDIGVDIHHLGMTHLAQAPFTLWKARQLMRRLQPAIVHGVLFYGDLTARLLRLLGVAPHVVSAVHSTYVGGRWPELAMRVTDRFTDAVTAVSRTVADAQIAAKSVFPKKVSIIENGIDFSRFVAPPAQELTNLRRRLGLTPEDRVLLCVGRLAPEKNHALLLRVFGRLRRSVPRAKLLLVGSGELDAPLRALTKELGLSESVVFAGPMSPVGPVFFVAELFVLASWLEGLPLVVLEAMAAGCPMVLTAVGGIPEVVHDGRTGLVVPPNDEAALERALLRMLEASPDQRQAWARAAHEEARLRFSMERMVERTQAVYDRILRPDAPPSEVYLADLYPIAHQ